LRRGVGHSGADVLGPSRQPVREHLYRAGDDLSFYGDLIRVLFDTGQLAHRRDDRAALRPPPGATETLQFDLVPTVLLLLPVLEYAVMPADDLSDAEREVLRPPELGTQCRAQPQLADK